MCGRTACTLHPRSIRQAFPGTKTYRQLRKYRRRYNVGPQTHNPIVFAEGSAHQGGKKVTDGEERVICFAKWGLVASFSSPEHVRGGGGGMNLNTINARFEGVTTSPLYRRLVNKNRCVVVADGFFEWRTDAGKGPGGKDRKVPHFIRVRKGEAFPQVRVQRAAGGGSVSPTTPPASATSGGASSSSSSEETEKEGKLKELEEAEREWDTGYEWGVEGRRRDLHGEAPVLGDGEAPLMMAGLYDVWWPARGGGMGGGGGASRSRGDTDQQPKGRKQEEAEEDKGVEEEGGQDDEPLWSYAVVTMESEGTRVEQVHHRMPLFLSPRTASMWLDPSVPFEKIKDEMAQEAKRIGSAVLEVIEVSDVVSSVRNNRRECVETREAVLKRQKAKGIGRFFTSTPAKGPAADTAQDRSKQQEDMQPSPSSSSSCSASAAAASVSTKRKQEEVSQDSLHRKDAPAPLASEDSPAEVHPYQKRIRLDAPLKEGDGNADEESGRRTEGEREGGHPEEDEVVQIEDDDAAPSPTRPGSSSTAHTQRASTNFPPDQQTSTRPLAPSVASRQTSTDTQPKRNPTAAAQAKPKAKAKSKAPPSSAQAKTILSFFKKTSS